MVGLDQQSAPKQLISEVPSHVVLVNDKVGALYRSSFKDQLFLNLFILLSSLRLRILFQENGPNSDFRR